MGHELLLLGAAFLVAGLLAGPTRGQLIESPVLAEHSDRFTRRKVGTS